MRTASHSYEFPSWAESNKTDGRGSIYACHSPGFLCAPTQKVDTLDMSRFVKACNINTKRLWIVLPQAQNGSKKIITNNTLPI